MVRGLCLFGILLLLHGNSQGKKIRQLNYLTFTSKFNAKFMTAFSGSIMDNNRVLEVNMSVPATVNRDIWIELNVSMRPSTGNIFRRIINFTLNLCDLVGKSDSRDSFNVLQLWSTNLRDAGTTTLSCPLLKGNYSWRLNSTEMSRTSKIHAFQLEGKYRSIMNFFLKKGKTQIERALNITALMEVAYV